MNRENIMDMNVFETLKKSTMFHMSLGSKELFHSNFLHWISIVNWDAFLGVMHGLAGVEKFWWEKEECRITGYNKKYSPQDNNLEVRRESNSFDISIYILVEETHKEDDDKKQKWIPVIVLENKVKSIPYKEQLERYEEKAIKDWRKKDWINGRNISFILLSLWRNLPDDIFPSPKPTSTDPKCTWKKKSYEDLYNLLSGVHNMFTDLNKNVLDDYIKFISSLDNLANNAWEIKGDNVWEDIYPWKFKIYKDDPYVKLRIHDLWEKIHYEQLLKFLMKKLKDNRVEITQDRDKYKDQKDEQIVLCASGYAHNIGLFEAWIKGKDGDYIIQVQGDSFHRGYLCDKGKDLEGLKDCYFLRKIEGFEFKYKTNNVGGESLYSFKDSNRNKVFYYSKAEIESGTKIETIIEAMCKDILSFQQVI